jgi:phosphoribosylformimino-5-aminoimidazole carboxamide ribotide isomerase
MYLLPAIDLLDGRVVRLKQGDYADVTCYNSDPVQQAMLFREQGASWIHVVDLNGAQDGCSKNLAVIKDIIAACGLKVEVGGGIRSLEAIDRLAKAGAARLVIGTALVRNPDFAHEAAAQYGELICAGVDARGGMVAINGWQESSRMKDIDLICELKSWGISHMVYTDIARDGMQTGIDVSAYRRVAASAGFAVTASGGISSLDDLRALMHLGDEAIEGIISGKAIYEGSFSVKDAVELLSGETGV